MPKQNSPKRILKAASKEFSLKGFSGARVDDIAKRAGINKQLIYYYFENKEKLYTAVLEDLHNRAEEWIDDSPDEPGENFKYWLMLHAKDQTYLNLVMWEGLELKAKAIPAQDQRHASYQKSVEKIRSKTGPAFWPSDLDPEQAFLTWLSMIVTPFAIPQVCLMITGKLPTDPEFLGDRAVFFDALSKHLTQEVPVKT
jgi:AcrR family transcriptional regulator